jgi:hypothetical protein
VTWLSRPIIFTIRLLNHPSVFCSVIENLRLVLGAASVSDVLEGNTTIVPSNRHNTADHFVMLKIVGNPGRADQLIKKLTDGHRLLDIENRSRSVD